MASRSAQQAGFPGHEIQRGQRDAQDHAARRQHGNAGHHAHGQVRPQSLPVHIGGDAVAYVEQGEIHV